MNPETTNPAAPVRKPIILVVDDDAKNLAVVRDCLVEFDYTILVAEDGESALQRAEYARPDIILLDIMMPDMDGFETCRRLKLMDSTKDIPVIFMTALAETVHKVKGLGAGAVDYITKPFQREELIARISVHQQNRELTKRLQEANDLLEARVANRTAELARTVELLHLEIAERKRGEAERMRLAAAIEQAAEAVFMCSAHWLITYVNPAFERICGYGRDEILGRDAAILRSNVHEPTYYDQLRKTVARDSTWTGRIATRKKDGGIIEAEITVSSVRDEHGTIINYVFILRDVTHELKIERELRQAQKVEAIGTLAGGIAHDFNNILTAIIGFTDVAQYKAARGDSVERELERVQEASWRARELVNRILTFTRQSEQELKPVQVAPLLEEVLKLLRSTIPTTIEIDRHISTDPEGDVILADPTQLHQVLMNLGTNAAHAMRANGGVLSFSLSDVEVDSSLHSLYPALAMGPCLRITVSDTGHGMEPAVRERIFDPYFTTKKVGEGTGMGLAVVQGIVKNLGGAISVYSEPGQGTSFHIFLPLIKKQITDAVHQDTMPKGGTERILFVDDEQMLANLGQALLEPLGYTATVTTSSQEGLNMFRADPHAFDLVITDMTMPGLTGNELAKEMLTIRPDIPIILATGFSELINEKRAKEIGIKQFIMKPYAAKTLDMAIRKALMGGG